MALLQLFVELLDGFTQRFKNGADGLRHIVGSVLAQILVIGQRLAGEGVQEGFTEQLAVGGVAQVVDLAAGPLIGEDL